MEVSSFRLNPRVRWRWEGQDKVLLNTLIGMNKTAGEILELCKTVHSLGGIVEGMTRKYPTIPKEKLQTDTERLVQKLQKWNILIPYRLDKEIPHSLVNPLSAQSISRYFGNKLSAPVEMVFELTYNCNANCPFCYVSATKNFGSEELTTGEWKTVIDYAIKMQVFRVTFTGGEALLRRDFEELVSYASGKGLRILLLTNGLGLTEDRIQSLLSAGLRGVDVSFDGPDAKTHDLSRGVPNLFDHITKMVPILLEKNISVTALTSVTKMNVNRIPEIMELLNRLGVQTLFLAPFIPVGRGTGYLSLAPSIKEYITMLSQVYARQEEFNTPAVISYAYPATYYEKSIGLETYEELVNDGRIIACYAGITNCVVDPSGNVRPCRVSEGISLGNIRVHSLEHIWLQSPIFRHLRDISKRGQVPCTKCKFNEICLAGCNAQPMQIGPSADLCAADFECRRCFEAFKPDLER